jgi:hypothetical protein
VTKDGTVRGARRRHRGAWPHAPRERAPRRGVRANAQHQRGQQHRRSQRTRRHDGAVAEPVTVPSMMTSMTSHIQLLLQDGIRFLQFYRETYQILLGCPYVINC